jgi:hypothetical protein
VLDIDSEDESPWQQAVIDSPHGSSKANDSEGHTPQSAQASTSNIQSALLRKSHNLIPIPQQLHLLFVIVEEQEEWPTIIALS